MSHPVIVGVDGSTTAASAAVVAATLAAALAEPLQVICAYEAGAGEVVQLAGDEYDLSSQASAQALVEDAARLLGEADPRLSVTAVAAPGKPAEVLVAVAEKVDARVIVVGNKRVQGVARLLGSIATDVAHRAPCDVYIAHTHAR